MSEWLLILTLVTGDGAAISQPIAFKERQSCVAAGQTWRDAVAAQTGVRSAHAMCMERPARGVS